MLKNHVAVISLSLLALTASAAVQVVPGSGAAYMYFPSEGDSRATIKIIKETGGRLTDRYEVHYSIDGSQEELLCNETDVTCEKKMATGKIKLHVVGDWVHNNNSIDLPMQGKFSEDCSTLSTHCQMTALPGETYTVQIKVGCDGNDYSVIKLDNNNQVLCVDASAAGNNLLIAAHKKIADGKRPKNKKEVWEYKSDTDGVANTKKIMDKWKDSTADSAAHYCNGLSIGSGSSQINNWYLPAIDELWDVLNGWVEGDFIIPKHGTGYYSSTESSNENTRIINWSSSSTRNKSTRKYDKTDGATLCVNAISH